MAVTYEVIHKTVMGNKRVHVVSCSLGEASNVIDTGLSVIHAHSLGCVSMATAGVTFKKNIGSGATARNGIMNFNSGAVGDVFHLVVYGV